MCCFLCPNCFGLSLIFPLTSLFLVAIFVKLHLIITEISNHISSGSRNTFIIHQCHKRSQNIFKTSTVVVSHHATWYWCKYPLCHVGFTCGVDLHHFHNFGIYHSSHFDRPWNHQANPHRYYQSLLDITHITTQLLLLGLPLLPDSLDRYLTSKVKQFIITLVTNPVNTLIF